MEYSKYQKDIFEFILKNKGNAIVQAVAGSGKTTTIIESANLLPQDTRNIFVAFNKNIADELQKRLPKSVQAKTLHSLGLSMFYSNTGVNPKLVNEKTELIIEDILKENMVNDSIFDFYYYIIKQIVQAIKITATDYNNYKEIESLIIEKDIDCNLDDIFFMVKQVLEKCRKQVKEVDFDDMLWIPVINNFKVKTYDWVFVDEAQDLNKVQFELIKKICNGNTRIIAVGDRKQSIYAFRGADTKSMDNFKEYFNCIELPLSISYRCSKEVVKFAKQIVPEIEEFSGAKVGIVNEVDNNFIIQNANSSDMVLCRTNAPLINIVFSFIRNNKKAIVRGRDIGKKLLKTINKYKVSELKQLLEKISNYKSLQEEKIHLIENGQFDKRKKNSILIEIDICDTILVMAENVENLDELKEKTTTIFSDNTEGIVCSSIHKAKGLEAKNIFIINYHMMPHPMAETPEEIQQEYNIKYVAITRAKENLYYSNEDYRKG